MATISSPHSVGFCATCAPAAVRASIFACAVPDDPEMMAPAWPILRPGGAVTPAMYATTGFVMCALIHSAARSSSEPPISPMSMTAPVSSSSSNAARHSMKFVPGTGSPPIPTHVVCPTPWAESSWSAW